MNHSHLRKFMLSTLTLWLALALASPAPAKNCSPPCVANDTTVQDCTDSSKPCQLKISTDSGVRTSAGGTSATYACVYADQTVTWAPPDDTSTVAFAFASDAPVSPTAGQSSDSTNSTTKVDSDATGCISYHVNYCSGGGTCTATAPSGDPKLVVTCPACNVGPNTVKKPRK